MGFTQCHALIAFVNGINPLLTHFLGNRRGLSAAGYIYLMSSLMALSPPFIGPKHMANSGCGLGTPV